MTQNDYINALAVSIDRIKAKFLENFVNLEKRRRQTMKEFHKFKDSEDLKKARKQIL